MEAHVIEVHADVVSGEPFESHDMSDHAAHGMATENNTMGMDSTDKNDPGDAISATEGNGHSKTHDHSAMLAKSTNEEKNLFKSVGVDEKLGQTLPLDISFTDENGFPITLSELVDRPTLLQLVFYHCPQTCNMMMANLANTLPSVTFKPGTDFRVVTISFDHEDTAQIATDTKTNYMNLLPRDFPVKDWRFLTGSLESINALTLAAGFRFKRIEQHNFIHPNVLIVLGDDGKLIRYLYGVEYLPFDVSMAITEATRGTPAISIKKILTYCFDYDPKGKRYVFKTFQVTGVLLVLILGAFFFFVLRKGNNS
ncbi:protein SCO1/2 [Desulfocicer vacuolatum DSM 3385]|uniref:Protein SCO1/2 n=2 Tax=Desulfocicer vacuolatum TaxID=2298 RepID=A0A1W2AGS7_9BACT|nr:protein SCO1/2 [Desulfocicer vacuolatum DSM 3385]